MFVEFVTVLGVTTALLITLYRKHIPYAPRFYIPGILARVRTPATKKQLQWTFGNAKKHVSEENSVIRRPNFIVIIADDLGINDISGGLYGLKTPNIDSIFINGIKFEQAYAGHATCAPSRASLMTGRRATRFGYDYTPIPKYMSFAMAKSVENISVSPILHKDAIKSMPPYESMAVPANETFIAHLLSQQGYGTYHIGKWHLGQIVGAKPRDKGYDESLVIYHGAALYGNFNNQSIVSTKLNTSMDDFLRANCEFAVNIDNIDQRITGKFVPDEYMTDFLTSQAIAAIENHFQDKTEAINPFFMTLAYTAPHNPLQSLRSDFESEEVQDLANGENESVRIVARTYAGMIKGLDRNIGRVLKSLRRIKQYDNTVIIFTSDNGAASYIGLPNCNKPFRGWKGTLFEGGIRVPFFMQWPNKIMSSLSSKAVVSHLDIFPTILEIAKVPNPDIEIDGKSLVSNMQPENVHEDIGRSHLYWQSGNYTALRWNQYKLQIQLDQGKMWLFDLESDPFEYQNLSNSKNANDTVVIMMNIMKNIQSEQPQSLWPALIRVPIAIDKPYGQITIDKDEFVYWSN